MLCMYLIISLTRTWSSNIMALFWPCNLLQCLAKSTWPVLKEYISSSLKKWTPWVAPGQRAHSSLSTHATLSAQARSPGGPWSFLVSPHSCPATSAPCTAESFAQWCRSPAPPGGPQSGGWTSPSASQLADWRWHPRWSPPGCFSWDLESMWISHGFRSRRVNTDLPLCLRSGPGQNVVRAFRNASDLLQNGKAPWWTPPLLRPEPSNLGLAWRASRAFLVSPLTWEIPHMCWGPDQINGV